MISKGSSNLDESTEIKSILDHENKFFIQYHKSIFRYSKSEIDRRLFYAYQVKRWKEDYRRNKGLHARVKSQIQEQNRLLSEQDF